MKSWHAHTAHEKSWKLAVTGYALMTSGMLVIFFEALRLQSGDPLNPRGGILILLGFVPLAFSPFNSRLRHPIIWCPIFWFAALILAAATVVLITLGFALVEMLWA